MTKLNDEQLAIYSASSNLIPEERDLLDTIADLKRQVAERDAQLAHTTLELAEDVMRAGIFYNSETGYLETDPVSGAKLLAAYVQEKVDRAVLAESEWWAENSVEYSATCGKRQLERLAANRAKVREGQS